LTTPVSAGDVTIAGLLAGVIGAILATVLSQLLAMARGVNVADAIHDLIGQGRMPPEMTGALEQVRDMPAAVFIIGSLLVALFIYPIFSMLGACSALRSSSANRLAAGHGRHFAPGVILGFQ
jgi:hypothetical protein